MTEIIQGVIIEEIEPLSPEEFNTILDALTFQRSELANKAAVGKSNDAEDELSDNAAALYDKLLKFEERVLLQLGIRQFAIIPMKRSDVRRLTQVWRQIGGERPDEDSQRTY